MSLGRAKSAPFTTIVIFIVDMFSRLTFLSNKSLMRFIQKSSVVLYGMGVFTGIGIMLAGMESKENNPEEALKFIGVTIVFLLAFILLYAFINTKLVPEIEKRLNLRNKK